MKIFLSKLRRIYHTKRLCMSWCTCFNYFHKLPHFRYLRGLWIGLCHLSHKFSIYVLHQVKKEYIPINIWHFSFRDSSDEDCVFAGLKKFFSCSWFFKFVVEWTPAVKINTKITFSPKYHLHYWSCSWIIRCSLYVCGVESLLIL